ncbi:hypothetical protein B0J12DRAFT_448171 [Macrophomina phaseolina]|uniref:Uncharacterized protein n=1 Tax=Macrophomina phaseolina TaxID=35725 RepID=A0ABQ8GF22_9PEZI|nr:hypothetical protein B0J12DRAFT_448171 [Macrophomina phaseolina]
MSMALPTGRYPIKVSSGPRPPPPTSPLRDETCGVGGLFLGSLIMLHFHPSITSLRTLSSPLVLAPPRSPAPAFVPLAHQTTRSPNRVTHMHHTMTDSTPGPRCGNVAVFPPWCSSAPDAKLHTCPPPARVRVYVRVQQCIRFLPRAHTPALDAAAVPYLSPDGCVRRSTVHS